MNFPLRACLGIDGALDDVDPRLRPDAYQALHFHDDDPDDTGWDDDVVLPLMAELPGGVYGLHVEAADGTSDTVPFIVVPAPGTRRHVLVALPMLAYLAYSCEHVMANAGARAPIWKGSASRTRRSSWQQARRLSARQGIAQPLWGAHRRF